MNRMKTERIKPISICEFVRFVPKEIYEQKSEKNTLEIQENCRHHEYVKEERVRVMHRYLIYTR